MFPLLVVYQRNNRPNEDYLGFRRTSFPVASLGYQRTRQVSRRISATTKQIHQGRPIVERKHMDQA